MGNEVCCTYNMNNICNILQGNEKIVDNSNADYYYRNITKIQGLVRGRLTRKTFSSNLKIIQKYKTPADTINDSVDNIISDTNQNINNENNNNGNVMTNDIDTKSYSNKDEKNQKYEKDEKENTNFNKEIDDQTPQFVTSLRPGELISDSDIKTLKLSKEVIKIQNTIGPFIIEHKELLKSIEAYKTRLKKYQILYGDGSVYVGYYDQDWNKEGYGILISKDGSKYEGSFNSNKFSGRGRLIERNGSYYEGEFEDDKANGFGKYVDISGYIYIGHWKDQLQCGKGEEIYPDGYRYEGFFNKGFKQGKSKFITKNGSTYEGEFNQNLFEGYGVYRWRDGRIYQGEWNNNKMNGTGIFIWPDRKKYIGQY